MDAFHKDSRQSSGRRPDCKACVKARSSDGRYLASAREWRNNNLELSRSTTTRWQRENRGRMLEYSAARRAKTRTNCPRVAALYAVAAALRADGWDVHVDHIVPLSKGGPHVFENLQILPAIENLRKGARV